MHKVDDLVERLELSMAFGKCDLEARRMAFIMHFNRRFAPVREFIDKANDVIRHFHPQGHMTLEWHKPDAHTLFGVIAMTVCDGEERRIALRYHPADRTLDATCEGASCRSEDALTIGAQLAEWTEAYFAGHIEPHRSIRSHA